MKYRIQCADCDWTLTDLNSVRVYVGKDELFSKLIPGESAAKTACFSENFHLEPDGSFDEAILHAFRLSGEMVVSDSTWWLVCAECGHGLQEAGQMKWYVRTECGDVRGPMSREDAEFESVRLQGAVMYNERIFEPQFVTTEEVDSLLEALRAHKQSHSVSQGDDVPELCQRAIDTITLLSKKSEKVEAPAPSSDLKSILVDLRLLGARGLTNTTNEILQRVMRAVLSLSGEKVVTGSIKDGVLTLGQVPEGVTVAIYDYDISAEMRSGKSVLLQDPELLKTDDAGNKYFEVG